MRVLQSNRYARLKRRYALKTALRVQTVLCAHLLKTALRVQTVLLVYTRFGRGSAD
jgi:hypothetical protein